MQIGIIDSGIGGLCFLKMLKGKFPFFDYLLFMDKAYFPYGTKEINELKQRGKEIINYLKRRCQKIVIACNTLSIILEDYIDDNVLSIAKITIQYLKEKNYKKIGLIASKNTIESNYYQNKINIYWTYIATKEIEEIEKGKHFSLANICFPDIDVLILGCTHFIQKKEAFKSLGFDIISQDEIFMFPYGKTSIQSSQQGLLKDS